MRENIDDVVAYFRRKLSRLKEITFEHIRDAIDSGPFTTLTDEQKEEVRTILEASYTITQKSGYSVKSDYVPWLQDRKSDIDFYYWNRLRDYLLGEEILPPHVLSRLDSVSSEILDYCGNPDDSGAWSRRGMVMGHVQSGKTTNYTALICKAADAGYRIIILLTGLTNSLRAQTQQRLDETFIGRKSIFHPSIPNEGLNILNYATKIRKPLFGTTRHQDFSRVIAQNYGVALASTNEPTIFITKKHKGTLENLRDWIRDQNQGERVPEPLLLIDDEADNASINTSKDPLRSTAINTVIREILQLFKCSSYLGYTATPFANIFIDPDSDHEMLGDELFPRNFIKSLDPPTNYIGAHRLFDEEGDLRNNMVKVITDHSQSLPLVQSVARKHKYPISGIPPSLREAIRVFLLTVTIRHLMGDGKKHCSMMINVSRFNDVQAKVEGEVYQYLQKVKNSVAVNARLPGIPSDPMIDKLQADFQREFADSVYSLDEIMFNLHRAISSVKVVTVNMRGGNLDYEHNRANGLHVIAIGGLALSRGLTLEGLTVSYIIRNASASDTLMQMARWFGYRSGYEHICRLYLPESSLDHYDQIHSAIEELNGEIKVMDQLGQTPEDFGLKVRQSPTGIRITAANKMRNASEFRLAQNYSGRHIEGHALLNDESVNLKHREMVQEFMRKCGEPRSINGGVCWHNVPGHLVTTLLKEFIFPPVVLPMVKVTSDRSLLDDYLTDRISHELKKWDVYVPGPVSPFRTDNGLFLQSRQLNLRLRRQSKVRQGILRINDRKNRVADRADAKFGLSNEQIELAKETADELNIKGDRMFCLVRARPLLIIHLLTLGDDRSSTTRLKDPVVTLSVCLPRTDSAPVEHTYQVNQVFRKAQLSVIDDEVDDDEELVVYGE